jgi:hypothetical protein
MKKLLLALLAIASFAVVSEVSAGSCNTGRCRTKCAPRCEEKCEKAPICEYTVCKQAPATKVCKTICHWECPPNCTPKAEHAERIGAENAKVVSRSRAKDARTAVASNESMVNNDAAAAA